MPTTGNSDGLNLLLVLLGLGSVVLLAGVVLRRRNV
jgi:hypothetical protein